MNHRNIHTNSFWVTCLFALLLLSGCEKGNTVDPSSALEGLNLPDQPFDYTPVLPVFYTAGPVNNDDNMPTINATTDMGATLGRVLFHDKNLSKNNTIACASCHIQAEGFADMRTLSEGFEGGKTGRQSMQLANARYYRNGHFFWDERAVTLEDQVLKPIQDPVEMGMDLETLVERLQALPYYPVLFKDAFGTETVSSEGISKALAQYVRSMVSYRSKYDEGRATVPNPQTNFSNFTALENQGKALFFSQRTTCAACHGTDAFVAPAPRNNGLDDVSTDQGVGKISLRPNDEGLFKVSSLKNIALTAPYMHDGRFTTLEEVIEHYNSGIKNHPNLSAPLRLPDGQIRQMNLTDQEKQALVAFLHTLTDTDMLSDEKFSDPFVK